MVLRRPAGLSLTWRTTSDTIIGPSRMPQLGRERPGRPKVWAIVVGALYCSVSRGGHLVNICLVVSLCLEHANSYVWTEMKRRHAAAAAVLSLAFACRCNNEEA